MDKNLDNIVSEGFLTRFRKGLTRCFYAPLLALAIYTGGCGGAATTSDAGQDGCVMCDGGDGGDDNEPTSVGAIDTSSVSPDPYAHHEYNVGDGIDVSMTVPDRAENCSAVLDCGGYSDSSGPTACTPGATYSTTLSTDGASAGDCDITITADADGLDSSSAVIDDVVLNEPENLAPVIDKYVLTSTFIGTRISGNVLAHDPEGEPLYGRFTLTSDYPGAVIDNFGGIAGPEPTLSELGNDYSFTVEVCDSEPKCDSVTFAMRVDPYMTESIIVYGSGQTLVI